MKLPALCLLVAAFALVSCTRAGNQATIRSDEAKSSNTKSNTTSCVNLNTASVKELIALDGIGDVVAQRVIEYRERHGRFRRPEEIIILEGFSEGKYRKIADRICVD